MNKNLFSVKTKSDRLLYRVEDEGYCFYSTKSMKFFFLDKITGDFLLEYLGEIKESELLENLEEFLGYSPKDVFGEIKNHYLKSVPGELLIS